MKEVTCPNCNVDVDPEELRRNHLCCPTCGYDLSEAQEAEEQDDAEEPDKEGDDDEEEKKDDEDQ